MKAVSHQVLITGAVGALGRAFAMECAARGWSLVMTDLSGSSLAPFAAGLRRTYGVETIALACDLADVDDRQRLIERLERLGIAPTLLVNIAGLDFEGAVVMRKRSELLAIVRLNVEATTDIIRAALALGGQRLRVVTVSSLAAFFPMPLKATYAASKRYLLQLSLGLREELRLSGGSATALCPAGLPTREEARRAIEAQGLLGRLTTVDVNRVVRGTLNAALRGRAVYVPGILNQVLRIAGGLVPQAIVARILLARWSDARGMQGLEPGPRQRGVDLVA